MKSGGGGGGCSTGGWGWGWGWQYDSSSCSSCCICGSDDRAGGESPRRRHPVWTQQLQQLATKAATMDLKAAVVSAALMTGREGNRPEGDTPYGPEEAATKAVAPAPGRSMVVLTTTLFMSDSQSLNLLRCSPFFKEHLWK